MSVLPSTFGSTTFSPKITSYELLSQRIKRQLGYPSIDIELSDENIYENIDAAVEYFSKFAGTTEEYLVFRSDLYIQGYGLPVDRMFNTTPELYSTNSQSLSGSFDYDLNAYRKVVQVFSYEQGNNSGVNTLFTIEHTVAQQAYFGHLLGNFGYDMVTWHMLKEWLDMREKLLGQMVYFRFDPNTQVLRLIPEPYNNNPYFGLVGCHLLRPIKDIVSQQWVFRYAAALNKITLGHIRGKFVGTGLFGGQTVNAQDVMNQGLSEKEKLEMEIEQDYTYRNPARFFVG